MAKELCNIKALASSVWQMKVSKINSDAFIYFCNYIKFAGLVLLLHVCILTCIKFKF